MTNIPFVAKYDVTADMTIITLEGRLVMRIYHTSKEYGINLATTSDRDIEKLVLEKERDTAISCLSKREIKEYLPRKRSSVFKEYDEEQVRKDLEEEEAIVKRSEASLELLRKLEDIYDDQSEKNLSEKAQKRLRKLMKTLRKDLDI